MVLNAEPPLATFVQLDTVCSVSDLHDMIEMIEARAEFIAVEKLQQPQQ